MKDTATVYATPRDTDPTDKIWTSEGYIEAEKLMGVETRWLEEGGKDIFQIKFRDQWITAQSQDFFFTYSK